MTGRSRAVVFDAYGEAEVPHTIDLAVAEPGPGLVRAHREIEAGHVRGKLVLEV